MPLAGYDERATLRAQFAWLARQSGMKYREIAKELSVSEARARQIVMRADRRLAYCARHDVLSMPVVDPIHYGITHTFTHEGRVTVDHYWNPYAS